MTGPEHYKKAEVLLVEAERDLLAGTSSGNWQEHDALVERAKVHATLALVAATLQTGINASMLLAPINHGGFDQPLTTEPSPWSVIL